MMQHDCVNCQSLQAPTHAQSTEPATFNLVKRASDQHISTTCSRRLRDPEDFLNAAKWMLKLHPRGNGTTLAVAADFAARMHHSKDGHVPYAVASMQQRLGMSRSTVMDHVRVLRELGLLVWVEHGSRRNVLRTRLGDRFAAGVGYRPTATIYAPCAPPIYDQAQGRLRAGTGYRSRIRAYTPHGRTQAIREAQCRRAPRTPSYTTPTPYLPAPRGEEFKDSAPRSQRPSTTAPRSRRGSTGVTPHQAALGIDHAQRVRLEIWWTQGTCLRQLGYALRPLIAFGYSWQDTARELTRWHVPTRPANAAAYIRSELRRRANSGLLHLPSGSIKPYRQPPADEAGDRYTKMINLRAQQYGPAFERYRATLAAPLRAALKQHTRPHTAPRPSRPTPQLREPEHLFRDTWSALATPLDVSRTLARAPQSLAGNAPGEEMWDELAEHDRAAAAFQRLREDLEDAAHDASAEDGSTTWERSELPWKATE
ncbi:winged helix-turn-helix domain-containing protein [Streptomyces sp. NPDC020883]|uniref:winged helix-turn-helix domain-containing protein n=1 Tax=Streptomyces sp. NPDC020883 TaxID=3365099 RepID=UPI00378F04F8